MTKEEKRQQLLNEIEHLESLVFYTKKLLDKLNQDLDLKTEDDYELYYSVLVQFESYQQYIEDLQNQLEEEEK